MCLGIPGLVTEITETAPLRMGRVSFEGVSRQVCLEYVPEAVPGDYVLVHVGFALTRIDESEAQRVFDLLKELPLLDERSDEPGPPNEGDVS